LLVTTKSSMHLTKLDADDALWGIFLCVGIASLIGLLVLLVLTRKFDLEEWIAQARDLLFFAGTGYAILTVAFATEILPPLDSHSSMFLGFHVLGLTVLALFSWLVWFRGKQPDPAQTRLRLPVLAMTALFLLFLIPLSADYFKFVKSSLGTFWVWMTP